MVGRTDVDAAVAQFLGKAVPRPTYDETYYADENEQFLQRMRERGGYVPVPYP